MTWTEEQVRALVTDAGTLKRGQELTSPAKWANLGQTNTAAWGECAGSGAKPYLTGIDLTEPAFKCSCPSRVFPCKHGVGLLLLLARQPALLAPGTPPAWLAEWLDKRQTRQQEQVGKTVATAESPAPTAADPAAREKREAQRLQRMSRSAAELEAWLVDLIRSGLGSLEKQPGSYWHNQAARLVDGQLPGLATTVRELAGLRHAGPDWPERLLARLGELYLLVRAFQNLPQLPPDARQEVLQQVGITQKKEELLTASPAVADTWDVAGQLTWEEDRLTARRTWLRGRATGRFALILEYAFGSQSFPTALVPGGSYDGAVVFYPGLAVLRATPVQLTFQGLSSGARPELGPTQLLDDYAHALARNPWLREWPAFLSAVRPVLRPDETWALAHETEPGLLPLQLGASTEAWQMLAVGGGASLTFFGEWNGRAFRPLSYWPTAVTATPARP
ncbi:SWIM zinc finger family protein [Hymenobacter aquaticus]|uniref:SWIM zinc finger family protein n=1 Tax=Hymenobacter aquaticus TaxID=1867101 RepID=A0A4Z0Q659_9BACT|nr:SWIM zinc finger family protein [Hymenobacter aquaticus]TGE25165.1 SWIM zinc finger family protein [Hymenobacter aquaticus]